MDEERPQITRDKAEGPLRWAHDPQDAKITRVKYSDPITRAGRWPQVVNIKHRAAYDVYIGRANPRYGLPESIWHNPFRVGPEGSREEILQKYEHYVRSRPDLMSRLPELEGKRLACWCAPKACHGDVLLKLLEEKKQGK